MNGIGKSMTSIVMMGTAALTALVLHFIEDPDAFMRRFLLEHPNFLADEIAKGGKSAQRAQLCIASGFAPEEALPKA